MSAQRFIEITAKSLEEARHLAEKELREGEVITDYVILQAPAKGIFGIIGSPETRVRFTCKKLSSTDLNQIDTNSLEQQNIKNKPSSNSHKTNISSSSQLFDEAQSAHENSENLDNFDYGNIEDLSTSTINTSAHPSNKASLSSESKFSTSSSAILANQAYSNKNHTSLKHVDVENLSSDSTIPNTNIPQPYDLTSDTAWKSIENLIIKTANTLGITDIHLKTYYKNGYNYIEAEGTNLSALIGKNGKIIDALQYLTNILLNKNKSEKIKVILDIQGYRERRQKSLISLAQRMYRKVINTGKPIELKPMSTIDRRTIHLALKNKAGVETFSKGIEPKRRVIISPTKQIIERAKQKMKKKIPHHQSSTYSSSTTTKSPVIRKQPHKLNKISSKNVNSKPSSQQNIKPIATSVPMFLEGDGSNES